MRRAVLPLLGLLCGLGLWVYCYRDVLFADEQFGYRDAGHFYYPLHLRVQQEWDAGRWPLWDPGQNGGTPLLGYPMAAVLYPGKIVFAVLSYPWAARVYVVSHTVVAFLGMLALGRSLGIGAVGSSLGALSYAFGAPVLFQQSNVIFLVGAAWVPWGLRAIDRLLRRRRRVAAVELVLVLALQVLGGDPEAAYLTTLCGMGYAVVLAWRRASWPARLRLRLRLASRPIWFWLGVGALSFFAWVASVLVAGAVLPERPWPGWLPGRTAVQAIVWGGIALGLVRNWRRQGRRAILAPALAGVGASGLLALALSGAQLLPVLEFSGRSDRATGEDQLSVYMFSLEPSRLVELAYPNVFGTFAPENRSWSQAFRPTGQREFWLPSLYMGSLSVALALGLAVSRGGSPGRTWLCLIAALSLSASFGRYAGPLWWVRGLPSAGSWLGGHNPSDRPCRDDGFLGDEFGSPYALLSATLPGFALFRYPSKLLTFTAVAISGLAGMGWDAPARGRTRGPSRCCVLGLAAGASGLALLIAARPWIEATLAPRLPPDSSFGPADLPAALDETRRSLIHAGIMLAIGLGLIRLAPRRPRLAGAAALIALSCDLGLANARLIYTVPQAAFETPPSLAAELIASSERRDPSPGPFRIHRMETWMPGDFTRRSSPLRLDALVRWRRDTLQPMFGLPLGFQYTRVRGYLDLLDYMVLFRPAMMRARGPGASFLGVPEGTPVLYTPRRVLDLWNARYFILPVDPGDWMATERSIAALLPETELLFPARDRIEARGPDSWRVRADWMLLKNRAAYPRAWLVHSARIRKPVSVPRITDRPDDDRLALLEALIYQRDLFWRDPGRPVYDLRYLAFVETDDPSPLAGFISPAPVTGAESVTITSYRPQRVELTAVLERPGLVILADTDYPGWHLTIDGHPAPIYRANLAMRGAAVRAGTHRLVFTYEPASFRHGARLSTAGAVALLSLIVWAARAPRRRRAKKTF